MKILLVISLIYLALVKGNKPDFAEEEKEVVARETAVYTVGGTAQGAACAFPFVYKGRTYNSCTKHYHSMYWCSTTYDYAEDKKWGNCLFTENTNGGTADGAACVFPFLYKGRLYGGCTKDDYTCYWCSTTYDYAKDRKWGRCLKFGK